MKKRIKKINTKGVFDNDSASLDDIPSIITSLNDAAESIKGVAVVEALDTSGAEISEVLYNEVADEDEVSCIDFGSFAASGIFMPGSAGVNIMSEESVIVDDMAECVEIISTDEAVMIEEWAGTDDDSALIECVDAAAGTEIEVKTDGVFVAVGQVPQSEPFVDLGLCDAEGYFAADESTETMLPGIFVAGDCRTKSVRQLTTACSDGTNAAMAACRYLDNNSI